MFLVWYICKIWHVFAYFSTTMILTYSMQNVKPSWKWPFLLSFGHKLRKKSGNLVLASPDGPSLIFYHSDLWTTSLLWKTELPWNFWLCWNIFYLSGLLSNLLLALKNRLCPELTALDIYIFNNSEVLTACVSPVK